MGAGGERRRHEATAVARRMVADGSTPSFVRTVLIARFGLTGTEVAAVLADARAASTPAPERNVVDDSLALARLLARSGTDHEASYDVLVRTFGFTADEAGAVLAAIDLER